MTSEMQILLVAFQLFLFCIKVSESEKIDSVQDVFPKKYFDVDEIPDASDIDIYLNVLDRLLDQRSRYLNYTDSSANLGVYFTLAILKRTHRDYKGVLGRYETKIKDLINKCENVNSHFYYRGLNEDKHWYKYYIFSRDTSPVLAHSISKFNTGLLPRRLFSNVSMNEYVIDMDHLRLPRHKYAELIGHGFNPSYYITIMDSDECIGRLLQYEIPFDYEAPRRPCSPNPWCKKRLFRGPSVAYTLSHRLLNLLMSLLSRRCYYHSEEYDMAQVHELCAEMYREAVYIARMGFFARDLFMEHVALCSMFGYEEMHRRKWYQKVVQWVDSKGCITETENFIIYRYNCSKKNNTDQDNELRAALYNQLQEECSDHHGAVAAAMMASAIRHAAHYL